MRTKITSFGNISDFSTYKVLIRLSKPHSRSTIGFFCNDPDGWTIDKITYENKSGKIKSNEGVNEKSFPDFVKWYKSMGYEEVK